MTDAEELALLEQLEREIRASAEAAYEELTQRVINGEPPQKVLKEINERVIGEHKAAFATALSEVLERSVGSKEAGNWPVGDITLSERLHANAQATALTAAEVIRQHVAAFDQAKTLAMQLYEGYDFNPTELLNPARPSKVLPKYLKRAMKDPGVRSSIVRTLSRIQASTLRTPALRAAYLQAIDDAARGAGAERLKKQLWVAYQEKMRYTANRIATTELHSAYETKKAQGIMADEQLKWVQVRMSAYHPKTDLCDYFSSVNAYGKGPGVYPKGKAPKPTYHPFCRCVIVQRFDLDQEEETKRNAAAESSYLQSLDDKVSARIQRELARAHDSKNPYRVRSLADVVGKSAIVETGHKFLSGPNIDLDEVIRLGEVHFNKLMDSTIPDTSEMVGGEALNGNLRGKKISDLDSWDLQVACSGVRQRIYEGLSESRAVGGSKINVSGAQYLNNTGELFKSIRADLLEAQPYVNRLEKLMPDDFIEAANKKAADVKVEKHIRPSYNEARQVIKIDKNHGHMSHEYAHHLQYMMPDMQKVYQALHDRRTLNHLPEVLYDYLPDELGKADGYVERYMGREYGERGALELMSTTFESVFSTGVDSKGMQYLAGLIKRDPELMKLTLGLLHHYKP